VLLATSFIGSVFTLPRSTPWVLSGPATWAAGTAGSMAGSFVDRPDEGFRRWAVPFLVAHRFVLGRCPLALREGAAMQVSS
jgi:hypothetical protein